MITVNFRDQSGDITTRRFDLSQGVSVYGSVAGASGFPALFTGVRMEVPETGFLDEVTTNMFGDYAFWFVAPRTPQTITINITATFSVHGQETTRIPIAVGESTRIPPVTDPPPSTELGKEIANLLPSWDSLLIVGGVILLIVAAVYFFPVWFPRIKKAIT